MRSVVFRLPDLMEAHQVFDPWGEPEVPLQASEGGVDGEWLLAIFELGASRKATSAAARLAADAPDGLRVVFEPRDWARLCEFARGLPVDGEPAEAEPIEEPPATARSQAPPRADGPAASRPTRSAPPASNAAILVVDDDADVREVVSVMLEAVGLRVTQAASAEDALEALAQGRFDLVVLDWNLPKMSGLELCRALRRDARHPELPVLFLTANASSQDMVDAFASGGDDYVVKPFRAPELGARIFSLLRRAKR